MLRILRWLRRSQFDVVQSFFPDANTLLPFLAKLAGVPVMITTRRNQNHWMTPGYLRMQRLANHFTTRVLANSERVKQAVVKMEKLPPGKVDVVYNGVDTGHFRPSAELRNAARSQLMLGDAHIAIGIMANLRPVKRIDLFLRAAAVVTSSLPHARFLVIGEGPSRSELERLVEQLGLQDRVNFLGALPDPLATLNALDVAVLCSDSEGMSNAVLEYLACGLPCVVTDVGGNREAVRDTGIVIPPNDSSALADALVKLAAGDGVLRQQYSQMARQRACATFSIKSAQDALREFYAAFSH
jgi:glycosyltransferase involved in cell wall biosynthesis